MKGRSGTDGKQNKPGGKKLVNLTRCAKTFNSRLTFNYADFLKEHATTSIEPIQYAENIIWFQRGSTIYVLIWTPSTLSTVEQVDPGSFSVNVIIGESVLGKQFTP